MPEVDYVGGNNKPRTALQLAAGEGHVEIIEMLLETVADINMPTSKYNGRTVLQAVAEGGHLIVVKKLVGMGAAVNAIPGHYSGRTALQAAAVGHVEVV